jgi:hypothetical protein
MPRRSTRVWVDIGYLLGAGRRNFQAEGYMRVSSTAVATATVVRRTKQDKHLPLVVLHRVIPSTSTARFFTSQEHTNAQQYYSKSQSKWPRKSAGFQVRIPPGTRMPDSCEFCVLSK